MRGFMARLRGIFTGLQKNSGRKILPDGPPGFDRPAAQGLQPIQTMRPQFRPASWPLHMRARNMGFQTRG
jgi:hypothetical protein